MGRVGGMKKWIKRKQPITNSGVYRASSFAKMNKPFCGGTTKNIPEGVTMLGKLTICQFMYRTVQHTSNQHM